MPQSFIPMLQKLVDHGLGRHTTWVQPEPKAWHAVDGLLDVVLGVETIFSLGYAKPFPAFRFGRGEQAFGTPGAGGSFCFADPEAQVGFAYAMNKTGFYLWDDPREKSLRDAVYRCIA